jgi:hypothetical protein
LGITSTLIPNCSSGLVVAAVSSVLIVPAATTAMSLGRMHEVIALLIAEWRSVHRSGAARLRKRKRGRRGHGSGWEHVWQWRGLCWWHLLHPDACLEHLEHVPYQLTEIHSSIRGENDGELLAIKLHLGCRHDNGDMAHNSQVAAELQGPLLFSVVLLHQLMIFLRRSAQDVSKRGRGRGQIRREGDRRRMDGMDDPRIEAPVSLHHHQVIDH